MSGNKCIYFNCGSSKRTDPSLRMFRFPAKDAKRCKRWTILSGNSSLADETPESLSKKFICSKHFDEKFTHCSKLPRNAYPFRYKRDESSKSAEENLDCPEELHTNITEITKTYQRKKVTNDSTCISDTAERDSGDEDWIEIENLPVLSLDSVFPKSTEDTVSEEEERNTTIHASATGSSPSQRDPHPANLRSNPAIFTISSSQIDSPSSSRTNTPIITSTSSQKRKLSEVNQEESLSNFEQDEDYYDLFSKMIAMKFRKINGEQRLLAEKIINEVLFDARVGKLTIDHKLVNTAATRNNLEENQMRTSTVYYHQLPEQQRVDVKDENDMEFESFKSNDSGGRN